MARGKNLSTPARRDVLKWSAAAALSGLAARPLLGPSPARAQAQTREADVIVIGAGIAGLAAARHLVALDYEVILLEATDRIGGRVQTDRSLGAPFEIGAGWIHGPDGNPVSDLAKAAGSPTFVTDDESFEVFAPDGTHQSRTAIFAAQERLERLAARIDATFDRDRPLSEAIGLLDPSALTAPLTRWMLSAYTEFDTGAAIERLSALHFDEDEAYDGADVILTQGFDAIPRHLAQGLDIRLGTVVDAIDYEAGDGAAVHAGDAVYESDFVICTAPLGVLKAEAIAFDPPLPQAIRASLERLEMGNVTKIALKFADAHWPVETQYFGLITGEKGRWNYFLNYRTYSEENILLGLSVGAYAAKAEAMHDAEMTADAMDAVRTMFGRDVPDPQDVRLTRWSQDPFTRGAYSFAAYGAKPDDFDALARPVEKTLLFAGEHTTFRHHGTVHGAYMSGLEAARIIDEELWDG
ncbi:FAD-dependent oxidoreductase [Stappia stellulata]|uniref:flavin monoamine oxidase family protein n=1 Tax=Stappia stellulata TaxID=71235 RepID=UPI001CD67A15|nr:NAD(P)/FAD-dependent oxidoreductase [Stappia stellulata]MCA1241707.1 FAD-dependent oxidoreductase [Stappia stellulata]